MQLFIFLGGYLYFGLYDVDICAFVYISWEAICMLVYMMLMSVHLFTILVLWLLYDHVLRSRQCLVDIISVKNKMQLCMR